MTAMPVRRTLVQASRFAVVGLLATGVHIATAMLVHTLFAVSPLWSNVCGFLAAFSLSYIGHWRWTFEAEGNHAFAVPRFVMVALAGFAINHAIVFGITVVAALPLWMAMVPVAIVVPALSFWLNKTRVFQPARGHV